MKPDQIIFHEVLMIHAPQIEVQVYCQTYQLYKYVWYMY